MSSVFDRIAEITSGPMFSSTIINDNVYSFIGFGFCIRMLSPGFIVCFYMLLALHVYSYFEVILYVLKKRLGTTFGLLWVGIGVAILYNIVFNHFFAMIIKPGSPSDLKVY